MERNGKELATLIEKVVTEINCNRDEIYEIENSVERKAKLNNLVTSTCVKHDVGEKNIRKILGVELPE